MQPLTQDTPKPLLKVAGKALIEHQLERLQHAGITDVVINHSYLGSQIEAALGDGAQYGLAINYSAEAVRLETAGGIIEALPLLHDPSFIVVNADIWSDFDLASLAPIVTELASGDGDLAFLVLVESDCLRIVRSTLLSTEEWVLSLILSLKQPLERSRLST
jgi:MurNAc alpha-1-phosphate uridylyltransferase